MVAAATVRFIDNLRLLDLPVLLTRACNQDCCICAEVLKMRFTALLLLLRVRIVECDVWRGQIQLKRCLLYVFKADRGDLLLAGRAGERVHILQLGDFKVACRLSHNLIWLV